MVSLALVTMSIDQIFHLFDDFDSFEKFLWNVFHLGCDYVLFSSLLDWDYGPPLWLSW